jgi:hypothetical protein
MAAAPKKKKTVMGIMSESGVRATHLADPANIFIAGLLVESQIFVQAKTNVVPVQSIREFVQME